MWSVIFIINYFYPARKLTALYYEVNSLLSLMTRSIVNILTLPSIRSCIFLCPFFTPKSVFFGENPLCGGHFSVAVGGDEMLRSQFN